MSADEEKIEKEDDQVVEEVGEDKSRRKRKRKRKKQEQSEEDKEKEGNGNVVEVDDKTAQVDRTVFVEGIPYTCSDKDVREFFVSHGLENFEDVRLPVWQDSGRLRGYGHVVFTDQESRHKAVALSGKYLQSRYLSIKPAAAPKGGGGGDVRDSARNSQPSQTIMLQNLSYDATEDDIQSVLEKHGAIAPGGIRVVRHSSSQRSKGFAYVEFESLESAKAVYESTSTQPCIVLRRPCRVDYDNGRMKGSYRGADGRLWEKEYGGKSGSDSKQDGDGKKRVRKDEE